MTVGTGTAFGQRKSPQALLSYGLLSLVDEGPCPLLLYL